MKRTIIYFFLTVLVYTPKLLSTQQLRVMPKNIRAKGDYIHPATQTVFPLFLFNEYQRDGIHSFDKPDTNIGVNYTKRDNNGETRITIYIYPAGDGTEDRLRGQYWVSLQMVANDTKSGLKASQFAVKHNDSKYICNGYKAIFPNERDELSQMTLYECGTWFFKIRTTSNILDSIGMKNLDDRILEQFNPALLTANHPLNTNADIYFAPGGFRDSLMLGSVMGGAFKKMEWARDHIEEKEMASGFPGQYLELHEEALKATIAFEKRVKIATVSPETRQYLDELNTIINSGFLGEFIMDQFRMVLIVPEEREFDFEGFEKWKGENPISIDLTGMYYVISLSQN